MSKPPRLKHVGKRFGVGRKGVQVFFHDQSAKKGAQVKMDNAPRARALFAAFVKLTLTEEVQKERPDDQAYLMELVTAALHTLAAG
jgi:hypothetical protein